MVGLLRSEKRCDWLMWTTTTDGDSDGLFELGLTWAENITLVVIFLFFSMLFIDWHCRGALFKDLRFARTRGPVDTTRTRRRR